VPNEILIRTIIEHEDNFFLGIVIQCFKASYETFDSRYRLLEEQELECSECDEDLRTCDCNSEYQEFTKEDITPDGKVWDDFAGCKQSKLFGIFTHCQWNKEEIEEQTFSNEMVLLQIGENGFNDEGVFTVTIPKEDLKKNNFNNCKCYWAQT
jgi:hypothetical protein